MTLKGQYLKKTKEGLYIGPGRTTKKFYFSVILKIITLCVFGEYACQQKKVLTLAFTISHYCPFSPEHKFSFGVRGLCT
jgi:hypothetical protein